MLASPRYSYIQSQVLTLLQSVSSTLLKFPLDVRTIIKSIGKCKISSYIYFSKSFGIPVDDVIALCSSEAGCTHYDVNSGKYLILYNNSYDYYNVDGRQLWTLAHELGHVILQHPLIVETDPVFDSSLSIKKDPIIEDEADYFAAQILSPVSLYPALNITSPLDVEHVFGLSAWASLNQFSNFLSWEDCHMKTSFEDDLLRLFAPFVMDARL